MGGVRLNRKIIVVAGHLAAGKSTFALKLSAELKAPCLIKDAFKSALCESVADMDREKSSRFSVITFDAMLYAAGQIMKAGYPVILEGNFAPPGIKKKDEAGAIRALVERYGYACLTFVFTGDTRVLYERFVRREETPERGRANCMFGRHSQADFTAWCRDLGRFDLGGERIVVDTTDFDKTPFSRYRDIAARFMN